MKTRRINGELVQQYQAKDISDTQFMKSVIRHQLLKYYEYGWDKRTGYEEQVPWAMRWDVENEFSDVPWKVLSAKVSTLIKRGYMDGCTCGCRGDYQVIF